MTTVIISKIQHRTGNIADLPQLDTAEIALAVDLTTPGQPQNRLFFGPAAPVFTNSSPSSNNIEILTQFSGVSATTITEADAANANIYYPIMGNAVSGSLGLWANANIYFNVPAGRLHTTELNVATDAVIGGNLVIDGSLVYINVETLAIEDPLIQQGTGPNGGFVPIADIKDRGSVYHFFGDGATFDNLRFIGWDSSASEFILGSDVTLNPNETVTVNQYGDLRMQDLTLDGNLAVNGGEITSTQATFNLLNTTTSTIIFGNVATSMEIGSTAGLIEAQNDLTVLGVLTTTEITTGAAATAGTIEGTWTLTAGSTLQATYADLAECYVSDEDYEPGTVLEFGGEYEVTIAEDETTRVAGVVSSNPAYIMNSNLHGEHVVALALAGRVPCKVRGNIRKGDMMISAGNGYARPTHSPKMGTIIGKSLEDFNGEGIIEIVVGRL